MERQEIEKRVNWFDTTADAPQLRQEDAYRTRRPSGRPRAGMGQRHSCANQERERVDQRVGDTGTVTKDKTNNPIY